MCKKNRAFPLSSLIPAFLVVGVFAVLGTQEGRAQLVLGTLLAFIAVAWLRDNFVAREISPLAVTLGVVAGLVLVLTAASLSPARQARLTQPASLLRED